MNDWMIAMLLLAVPATVALGVCYYWMFGNPYDVWENKE